MDRFIALLFLSGFVAGRVIVDRTQQDSQFIRGAEYGGVGSHLTRDQLLRQKFILDILQQVELPLQNQQLLELNIDGVLRENMYLGPLDDNMRHLLDLIRTNRALGRNTVCSMNNEEDVRQMVGLYLLLVRSQDFETFQRTAVYARVHLNPLLFVNALVLAVEDRMDTKTLIIPALYEILPRLYQDESLVRQVDAMNLNRINNNGNSIRPNILDILSLGRQTKQMKMASLEGDDVQNVLNRAQLWMPWRELHRQLAIQKSLGGNVIMRDGIRQDVIELTSSKRDGLIADDIGLKAFLNMKFDEMILKQSLLRNTQRGSADNMLRDVLQNRVNEIGIRGNNLNNKEIRGNIIPERQRLREDNLWDLDINRKANARGVSGKHDWLSSVLTDDIRNRDNQLGRIQNYGEFRGDIVSERQRLNEENTRDFRNNINGNLRGFSDESHWINDNNLDTLHLADNRIQNRGNQMGRWQNTLNGGENRGNIISERQRLREENYNLRGLSDESDWLNAHRDVSDNLRDQNQGVDNLLETSLNKIRLLNVRRQDPFLSRDNQLNNQLGSGIHRGLSQDDNQRQSLNRLRNVINMERLDTADRRQLNQITLRNDDEIRANGLLTKSGQQLLRQLQQIVVRLNIEDIALRKIDNILNLENVNLKQSNRIDIRLDDRQRSVVLNKINEISDRLNGSLQRIIRQMSNIDQNDALGQIDQIVLNAILNEVLSLCEYVPNGQVSGILENPTLQLLLRHIVNSIEIQLEGIRGTRRINDIALNSVRINDADIDRLHTYLEDTKVDLSNMLRSNGGIGNEAKQQIIIGRTTRLNHKPFSIKLNVNSDRNQRVVVRTLLLPKVGVQGNLLSPMQQRQNVVLLDIANVDLKVGRNLIIRRSRDITWTSRDSTTYSEIYQRVMRSLHSGAELANDIIIGQNNMLPHRLLVPRGRPEGLQMQLLVVITPAEENIGVIRSNLHDITLDNLPINYPLDSDLNDLDAIISLPNVHMKDVLIYHDNQL